MLDFKFISINQKDYIVINSDIYKLFDDFEKVEKDNNMFLEGKTYTGLVSIKGYEYHITREDGLEIYNNKDMTYKKYPDISDLERNKDQLYFIDNTYISKITKNNVKKYPLCDNSFHNLAEKDDYLRCIEDHVFVNNHIAVLFTRDNELNLGIMYNTWTKFSHKYFKKEIRDKALYLFWILTTLSINCIEILPEDIVSIIINIVVRDLTCGY